jgi:hypothetical protein
MGGKTKRVRVTNLTLPIVFLTKYSVENWLFDKTSKLTLGCRVLLYYTTFANGMGNLAKFSSNNIRWVIETPLR